MVKTTKPSKPRLVKIGKHYLDPSSVAGFKQAKEGLYIIVMKDSPELQYPLWVSERSVQKALKYFDVDNLVNEEDFDFDA